MSIRDTLKIFSGYPGQLSRLLQNTANISQEVAYLRGMISDLRRPSPFVLIFIQAVKVERQKPPTPVVPITPDATKGDYGFGDHWVERGPLVITDKPITLSISGEVPRIFSFQPDVPIANLHIAVICDIRMVRVEDICVANNHICPSIEAAPLAYYDGIVESANRITITTSLR